jgi:hypothetical protein
MIFRVPYRWLSRRFFTNIWWIITDITGGICNVIRWTPVIWFDADFQWDYLAHVMEYKLRRSARLELTVGHHTNSKRDGKRMLICADLLKRLRADEYWDNAVKRFGESTQAAKFCAAQQKADQQYLGNLIGKHFTHWWD